MARPVPGLDLRPGVVVSPGLFGREPLSCGRAGHRGGLIRGNIAFYAACPADAYVTNRMNSWGAPFNTLQFNDSAVDCVPWVGRPETRRRQPRR